MFEKGKSGNPGGRKKNTWRVELEKAIHKHGESIGKTPYQRLAELFYEQRDCAVGMANFFIPKLRTVEAKIDGESPFRLLFTLPPIDLPESSKQITQTLQVVSHDITSKQTADIEPKTQVDDDKSIR